ncbi:GMP synthase (glutamine-hydrolyzing) [Staphylococcus epidermidis]|uniref:GMP synthase (glutamine-hydrolyzing) n=1 Tax=Staphylococcus epidermidis TaxID=1282 RepID=UPI0037D9DED3
MQSLPVIPHYPTYHHTLPIPPLTSIHPITSHFPTIHSQLLQKISTPILNHLHHLNPLLYHITSNPPTTIHYQYNII